MEIQQSPLYADYIRALGWSVAAIDDVRVFYRRFPFLGTTVKMQRPTKLPNIAATVSFLQKHQAKTLVFEPDRVIPKKTMSPWLKKISRICRVSQTPYLPTKTIRVALKPPEGAIFGRLSEAKRRAVRRAQKNGVRIEQPGAINDLIRIKNKSAGLFGFITTTGIDKLWQIFAPDHATILLAKNKENQTVGGVLLLFWAGVAYYWIAGATNTGKKLAAPTLLVWEALKTAKMRRARSFDFVGIWDERTPKQYQEWKGFTKFKEGFGGENVYYPLNTL